MGDLVGGEFVSMVVQNGIELQNDLARMAAAVEENVVNGILDNAAQPVLEQMQMNASSDPKCISHNLHNSLSKKITGSTKPKATIGIHRTDAAASKVADYAYPVEFGHGGPHPAPAHPFVRPAFDARADEAYDTIREGLRKALD